jgi:hypothetical protein
MGASRACQCDPVEPNKTQALDNHSVTNPHGDRLGCGDHRGNAADDWSGLLVRHVIWNPHYTGARKNIAILREAPQKMRLLVRWVVPVLADLDALLWHIQHGAVVAIAAVEELGPRDPVTHAERLALQVRADSIPDLIDHTDDFMAKDAGGRIVPLTLPRVDI